MSGGWDEDDDFAAMLRRVNPDDPILRHIQARRIREHLVGAAGADPAQVARALDLAARAGVPFDVAERNLAQTQARAGADRYAEAMAGSPALGPWIARDPVNARIARHDYDNLGLIDQAWSAFTRGGNDASQGVAGMNSGQLADAGPQTQGWGGPDPGVRRASFNTLGDQVAGLTMARLSPHKTEEVVRAIVGRGGPRAVLVPVRDVQDHLGTLAPAEAEARAHAWGVDELLRHDVDTEGDLVTPTETYLARLHSEAGKDIGRNVRFAEPQSMGHCLGECAKKIARGDHYPSPSEWARDFAYLGAAAGAPFPKEWLGSLGKIVGEASHYTNLYSASRFLFPKNEQRKRLTMRRRLFNTKSIPGFVGKVSGFTAVPFVGYDAVHFGGCMGDCLGNPKPEDIEVPPHA